MTDISGGDTDIEDDDDDIAEQLNNLMEGTSRGSVRGNILLKYFRSGASLLLVLIMCFLYLLTQVVTSLSDYFVSYL